MGNLSNKITFPEFGKGHSVSPELYGIFFEDINFACDGGINANMVNNYSFDGIYYSAEENKVVDDPLRYWGIQGGKIQSGKDEPLHKNSNYAHISIGKQTVLSNLGYNGLKDHKGECAISIKSGHEYLYECQIRYINFDGEIRIRVVKEDGQPLTDIVTVKSIDHESWDKITCTLQGKKDGYGKLEIIFEGSGEVDLDCVSLMDADYWNKEDEKWRYGRLRKDLIQVLADLKPAFMRFPGGCIVEGLFPNNEYNWKDTVGELFERKSNYNLWAEAVPDGGYNQSYQIGFYEYFCLCEDLHMKPLPTLSVGLNCQMRSARRQETICPNIPVGSEEFKNKIIDNYLDLIEFANGDPAANEWAALRAKMGHPEPFGLDRIGVGNENYNSPYFERFSIIEKAIHEKYPDIICIFSGGLNPYYKDTMGMSGLTKAYSEAEKYPNTFVDEHSYHTPEWFVKQATRFDHYNRNGASVYFGEYAANGMLGQFENPDEASESSGNGLRPLNESNMLDTALGEAAFLTGVERNSDIVVMTSYAPLLNLVDSDQWNHDLINFNPKTVCLSVNYYVQKMFSTNLGNCYLPFEGDLPNNIYLSATENENNIYIKIVNVEKDAVQMLLDFPGNLVSARAIRLQSDETSVRNDLTFTEDADYRIKPEEYILPVKENCLETELKGYSVQVLIVEKE